MAISIEEIRKIASLARITLTSKEEERFAETISAILDYMKLLDTVDTSDVKPTNQVVDLLNITREDEIVESTNRDALIKNFPVLEEDKLKVPGVFSEL